MYYSNKYKLKDGLKSNSVCEKCKYIKISDSLIGKKLTSDHIKKLKEKWNIRKQNGYIGPMRGKHHTNETRQKMKISKQNNPPFLGKHHTEESKRKISESQFGRDNSKAVAIAALINKGKKLTNEHKNKISNALKGKKMFE